MKKELFFVVIFSLLNVFCLAQNYQVYVVKGDIKCNDEQCEIPITIGMLIQPTNKVVIPEDGRLVILDEANMKLHSIKGTCSGTLVELLQKEDVSVQQLTKSYMSYIKSKIANSGDPKDRNHMQSAGTSYRDPDSLLLQPLFSEDTLNNSTNQ